MPLVKRTPSNENTTVGIQTQNLITTKAPKVMQQHRETPMTKDDYWRKREERDIERDKHMAWSGLAQAALGSVNVAQLNTDNTEDGLVKLVARLTAKLLAERDSR